MRNITLKLPFENPPFPHFPNFLVTLFFIFPFKPPCQYSISLSSLLLQPSVANICLTQITYVWTQIFSVLKQIFSSMRDCTCSTSIADFLLSIPISFTLTQFFAGRSERTASCLREHLPTRPKRQPEVPYQKSRRHNEERVPDSFVRL